MAKKILVVEDDESISYVIGLILKEHDFDVTFVSSGKKLTEALKRDKFNLILLDIFLPDEDGKTICKRIKKDPKTSDIPIIILSAHANAKDIMKESGANGFLAKPFDIDALEKIVKNSLLLNAPSLIL